ncbi:unnamed protein product [Phytophthora fragariaefolia]|uniref:RxLR effector protein n=1 Tax=Phytophthora fragariaefolia TaxID=1490495 RepID=A0A9W6Y4B0_9STRA|nr:unnamed protein product [Phytophthora fragariaefolia]
MSHNNCHETNPLRMDRDLLRITAFCWGLTLPQSLRAVLVDSGRIVRQTSLLPFALPMARHWMASCHPYLRSIVHHSATCSAAIKTIDYPVRPNMRVFLAFLVAAMLFVKNDVAAATSSLSEKMSPDSVQMPDPAPRFLRYYTTAEEKEARTEERGFDSGVVGRLISAEKIDDALKSKEKMMSLFSGLSRADAPERKEALKILGNSNQYLLLYWNGYTRKMAEKAAKAARNAE